MDYLARLKRLRSQPFSKKYDALLIDLPIDLFYLTGLQLSAGQLIISDSCAALFVDGRYTQAANQQSLFPIEELTDESTKTWLNAQGIKRLGFNQTHTPYQRFIQLKELLNPIELIPIHSPIEPLRLIKDEDELTILRAAGRLAYEGFTFVSSLLKEEIEEKELAFELEFFWKKRGGSHLAFDSIIAFNENSSMPHYRTGNTRLKQNSSILIDIGVVLDHYNSDMTRVIFFGNRPKDIQTIYPIVQEAHDLALEKCRPGTLIGDLDKTARDWIESKKYGYAFTHSLGHGVGLEIHEAPTVRSKGPYASIPLEAGMVITIEPGIYLPGIGGVRIENTVVITQNGYEIITKP